MDDLFLTDEEQLISQTKRELSANGNFLGLMHCFLELEVWRRSIYEIHKFEMLDCKSMTTLMALNLKKLHDQTTGLDPEDPIVLDVLSTH